MRAWEDFSSFPDNPRKKENRMASSSKIPGRFKFHYSGGVGVSSEPHGNDYWKLNFVLNGVRDDGTHEFRRDNIALKSATDRFINWKLGPPPLDLVWKDTDANGLPLNPIWRGFEKFPCENNLCLDQACSFNESPLADDLNDYERCISQSPTYDRSWLCGWHVN